MNTDERRGFSLVHKSQQTPKIAVNAIVWNAQGEVLLAKRTDNGLWCLPGGHVDLGETLAQACERELFEETGLRGKVLRLVGVYSDPGHSLHIRQGPEWHTVRVSLLCEITGGTIRPSEETSEVKFFSLKSLPDLITDHARRIQDAADNRPEAVIH
jgi:ADP-ribose pyrophosphatase YjhB (NUDIX family)